jgi:hypothetical protein
VLCDQDCAGEIPEWVDVLGGLAVPLRGMGTHTVLRLGLNPTVVLPSLT